MKTCISCGATIEDRNNYCPYCGTACGGNGETEKPVYSLPDSPSANTAESTSGAPENPSDPRADQYPMGWHKFLMVAMILGGIVTIANGAGLLTGSVYARRGLSSHMVYGNFRALKGADTFYGVAMIALGVFEFIVRSRLKQFRANGPGSLKAMYILAIAASLIYMLLATSATGISMFDSSNLGSLGGSVVMLIINSIYYSKRSDLFVN